MLLGRDSFVRNALQAFGGGSAVIGGEHREGLRVA
jgi:hypothetical protein